MSPTLHVNPPLFVIPCKFFFGIIDLQYHNYCHTSNDVSPKFQSSMTIYHHKLMTVEGGRVFGQRMTSSIHHPWEVVHLSTRSIIREVTIVTLKIPYSISVVDRLDGEQSACTWVKLIKTRFPCNKKGKRISRSRRFSTLAIRDGRIKTQKDENRKKTIMGAESWHHLCRWKGYVVHKFLWMWLASVHSTLTISIANGTI